jgi:hypothetical protein
MSPLTDAEFAGKIGGSAQIRKYAQAFDRESAREMLARRMAPEPEAGRAPTGGGGSGQAPRRTGKEPPSMMETILKSSVTRTVAREVTRGLLGALLGSSSRRR